MYPLTHTLPTSSPSLCAITCTCTHHFLPDYHASWGIPFLRQEQLLERELVMDEVTTLSDQLRKEAGESQAHTVGAANKVFTVPLRLNW